MSFIQQTKKSYTSTVVFQIGSAAGSDRNRNEAAIKPVELTVDLKNGLLEEEELETKEISAPKTQVEEEPLEIKSIIIPHPGDEEKIEVKEIIIPQPVPEEKVESKPVEKDVAPEFIIKPRRQLVDEGESTKFKASFEGSSNTKVTWSKDDKEIIPDDHYKLFIKDDFYFLEIVDVLPEHGGSYTCVLSNPAGTKSTTVGLEVFEKPKPVKVAQPILVVPLNDLTVVAGDRDIKLSCTVSDAEAATVTWYKDGKELRQGRQYRLRFDGRVASLGLTQAAPTDCGLYECVITNNGHEVRTSCTLTVENDKREPPYFVQELEDMEVDDGDKVELVVEVKGSDPIDVFWIHNNKEIARDDSDYQQTAVSKNIFKLTISKVVPGDAGSFVCEAYNEFGDTDTFCNVSIREIEKSQAPDFIIKPKLTKVTEGANALFSCTVMGYPLPNVYWERDGQILQDGPKYQISQNHDKHTLVITKTSKQDGGKYICRLDNQMVSMVHSSSLIVQEKTTATTTDFRSVLKKRSIETIGTQSGTESEKSDKENENKHVPAFQSTLSKMSDNRTVKPKQQINETHTALRNKFEQNSVTETHVPVKSLDKYLVQKSADKFVTSKNADNFVTSKNADKFVTSKSADKFNMSKTIDKFETSKTTDRFETSKTSDRLVTAKATNGSTVNRPVAELKPFLYGNALTSHKTEPSLQSKRDSYLNKLHETNAPKNDIYTAEPFLSKSTDVGRFQNGKDVLKIKQPSSQVDFRKEARIKPMEIKKQPEQLPSKPNQIDFRNILKLKENESKPKENSIDFRSVLKPKASVNVLSEPKSKSNFVQHDFRHVLSHKTELISKFEPKILRNLLNQTVKYGNQVVLSCEIVGTPPPDIKWSVNKKDIKESKCFQLKYKDNIASLIINEAFSDDEGEYTLSATNSCGTTATSCRLSIEDSSSMSSSRSDSRSIEGPVAFPPKILNVTPTTVSATKNKSTEIKAAFNGEPVPTITWYKFKQELESDGKIHIKTLANSSVLTITDLQQADSGKYTIIAENDLGSDSTKISISVEDVPYSPMGRPFVSDVTQSSVSLTWYGPAYDGGSPIIGYLIEICKDTSRKWTTITDSCRNTFYQADYLEPKTQYLFRIRARNKHGTSEAGEPSELITTCDDKHSTSMDYESDDELPFEPRQVKVDPSRKFEDKFITMEEIGRGKFGNVFKCQDRETKQIWAAKILKCREKEKVSIRKEIEVMNKLHHPKVLMLWDAFEAQRIMVLVMEYIQGGELFERVISDDFELTERDVIHFMRQICDGLGYIHDQNVIHLDLKPENILCISNKTNQIKIIDFGLAQNFQRGESVKVLFGTPEFIAPEVVNYDEISFATDLWSVGVICYVLLSGLSPFLGDSENETLSNVTLGEYDFDDDAFTEISDNAKDFIQGLLIKKKEKRHSIKQCKDHVWLAQDERRIRCKRLNTEKLKHFMARRKWQKTGMAIRALGRMASLKSFFSNSMSSMSSSLSGLDESGITNSSSSSKQTSVSSPVTNDDASFTFDIHQQTPDTSPSEESLPSAQDVFINRSPPRMNLESKFTDVVRNGDASPPNSKSHPKNNLNGIVDKTVLSAIRTSPITSNGSLGFNTSDKSILSDKSDSPLTRSSRKKSFELNDSLKTLDLNKPDTSDSHLKPCFVKDMLDCEAFSGDVIRFDVVISEISDCDLQWYFEDDEIKADTRHIIDFNDNGRCSLIIRQVTIEDDGEYTCKVVNKYGETSCSAELIVCGTGAI